MMDGENMNVNQNNRSCATQTIHIGTSIMCVDDMETSKILCKWTLGGKYNGNVEELVPIGHSTFEHYDNKVLQLLGEMVV